VTDNQKGAKHDNYQSVRVSNTYFDDYLIVSPADIIIGAIAGQGREWEYGFGWEGKWKELSWCRACDWNGKDCGSILFLLAGSRSEVPRLSQPQAELPFSRLTQINRHGQGVFCFLFAVRMVKYASRCGGGRRVLVACPYQDLFACLASVKAKASKQL
jgi:hypothetical protein